MLLAADGLSNTAIAAELATGKHTVGKWRERFRPPRADGLLDEPRSGAPRRIGDEQVAELIDRTLSLLPLRPGQAERRTHDDVRHGTTSLFAALDVEAGTVLGRCYPRHRASESRSFLDAIEASTPSDLDVQLVLDKSATHKTKAIRDWLLNHPRDHVHFTPTSGAWINQVERWFALLTDRAIRRGVHRSVTDLERDITAFIAATNADPKPFRWVESADAILDSVKRFCQRAIAEQAQRRPLTQTSESGHSGACSGERAPPA